MRSVSYYMRKYGTSYYYATLFFPRHVKKDVMTLYAFVRIPDLVVDDKERSGQDAKRILQEMWKEWQKAYEEKDIAHERWGSAVELFHRKKIPFLSSESFWDAMLMDTEKSLYETYEELQQYMYGSAMVVGEMMCYLVDADKEHALPYARALWEAMQLTNFLRDVAEDRRDFQRIYMPQEELRQHGLSHDDVRAYVEWRENPDASRQDFMRVQIEHADQLYAEAEEWLQFLPEFAQKPIFLASKLYQWILRKIEKNNYDVFSHSARTTKVDKGRILLQHIR